MKPLMISSNKYIVILMLIIISARDYSKTFAAPNVTQELDNEKLVDCLITGFSPTPTQMTVSFYHLLLDKSIDGKRNSAFPIITMNKTNTSKIVTENDMRFEAISTNATIEELRSSSLNPNLPFVFFINGWNHMGSFEANWLYDSASVFVHHNLDKKRALSKNVIFIPWYISGLTDVDAFSLPWLYYRTMANYKILVDKITTGLTSLVDFIESSRTDRWDYYENPQLARESYYSKFAFYGHSLGAHLISHAAKRINRLRPFVKFGLIAGLDPASVCFQGDYGISAEKLLDSVSRVAVIHSNAGIMGATSQRGHMEIFINGGSFQPDCAWHDPFCNHARGHEVLRYIDDECMMVAYKCDKYEQFKLGACHTCEDSDQTALLSDNPECILVNLPEQNSPDYEHRSSSIMKRQFAHGNMETASSWRRNKTYAQYDAALFAPAAKQSQDESQKKVVQPQYHFVKTNPEHALNNNSLCFQHYQLRLLTISDDAQWRSRCPLSVYLTGEQLQVSLFEYSQLEETLVELIDRTSAYNKSLTPIVPETLHTGLLNFAGKARLFVGGLLDGINLSKWSKCMTRNKLNKDLEFTLDIAFMSDIRQSVRYSYSSILCGQWNPRDEDNQNTSLVLNLCKQSELSNVGSQINNILREVRFYHKHDSWQVSVLDSLFSLLIGWDPLKRR